MRVTAFALTDFRSYESVTVELAAGTTTFVGRNGQGKTNLVEAIGYASTLSSHRVAQDAPLVRLGAERAVVQVAVLRDAREQLIEVEIVPGRANRARLNRASTSRARDVLGVLTTVIFAPEDLVLVKGDPSERRRFLDDLVVARQPALAALRSDYEKVLKQRNALLKSAQAARSTGSVEATLQVWDTHLAVVGAQLMVARDRLVDALVQPAAHAYSTLAPGSHELALALTSSVDAPAGATREQAEELLVTALADRRREEVARGITLVGPHRDDLLITLGPSPAKGYASHGESWSCALALRLAAFELLRADAPGGDPVLILDDVFAELDAERRDRLAERVAAAEQVIITAAVAADVPPVLRGAQLVVAGGSVSALSAE